MEHEMRNSGIPVIGNVPWGTHFCQFYHTKEDLIDILVPYFKAGLENNECCMWVTAEPLVKRLAEEAMRDALPDFDRYLQSGQMVIVPHDEWYLESGVFSLDRVLSGWVRKLEQALSRGCAGLRVSGNTAWLEKNDWKDFTEYEEQVNKVVGRYRLLALCSYCLDKCGPYELIEVIANHQFALIRQEGKWELIESSERRRAEEELRRSRDFLDRVLNAVYEGVVVIDRNFTILEANDCFLKQYGVTREEAIGRPCYAIVHGRNKPCSLAGEDCPLQEVFATGKPLRFEHTHLNASGNELSVEISAFPLFDKEGNVEMMVEVLRDVTERRRAEEYVESLAKFPSENPYPIFRVAADGTLLYANAAGQPLLADWNCGVGQVVPEPWRRLIEEVFASGSKKRVEEEHAGRVLSFEVVPIAEARYVNLYGRDITERKKAEEALQHSEEYFRALTENSSDIIIILDKKGTITYASPSIERFSGYKPEELTGKSGFQFIHSDDLPRAIYDFSKAILTKEAAISNSFRMRHKDGSERIFEGLGKNFLDNPIIAGFVMNVRDITERKRAEEALRLSHRLLVIANRHTKMLPLLKEFVGEIRNYTGCAAVGIRLLDEEGNIPYQAYEGFSERFYELESPLSIKSDRCMCINVIKGETDPKLPFYTEGGSFYMNGTTRFLATLSEEEKGRTRNTCNEFGYESVALIPIRLGERLLGLIHVADTRENMVPLQMVRMLEDPAMELGAAIERLKAQEALAAEKERLNVTLLSIADGVITADTQGKVVLMNKVAETATGWRQQEAEARALAEVFHIISARTRERCENPVEKVLATGGVVGLADDTVLIARDGTERRLAESGSPICDRDGNTIGVVLVFRDITERLKMEEQLLNAQKLESVGILAGGIAHDFNNLLTLILGNVSLAKAFASPEERIFERLSEAEKACYRAKDLTQQLLTFSSGGVPIRKLCSVAELLRESVTFALRGSNCACEFSVAADLWPAELDQGQINQVINNLIINAVQAMPEGGAIEVGAENITVGAKGSLPLREGKHVKMAIEDHGIGISREHLSRIFDPFFTTKQKGSGLGLSTCHRIVKNHGGCITVESEMGKGSTFCVYLPASAKRIPKKRAAKRKVIVGQGRVLVMDDEEAIRKLAGDILSRYGFQVEFAPDGAEAIQLFTNARKSGKPFDVVILDLTVPGGMGGKETITELLGIDPEVKAIVSSGYSNDPILAEFRKHGFKGVVAKPYEIQELSRVVHDVVTGALK